MAVTEFAFLTTRAAASESLDPELVRAGTAGLEIQDRWCAAHPLLPSPSSSSYISTAASTTTTTTTTTTSGTSSHREERGAALFQQLSNSGSRHRGAGGGTGEERKEEEEEEDRDEGGGVLLITAHWNSPAHHHEWIASEANKGAFKSLLPFIVPERVVIFHVEAADATAATTSLDTGVGGRQQQTGGSGMLFPKETLRAPILSVLSLRLVFARGREGRSSSNREVVERLMVEKGQGTREGIEGAARPREHRAGWRIEREKLRVGDTEEEVEELVIVGGWESEAEAAQRFDLEAFAAPLGDALVSCNFRTFRRIV